MNNVLYLGLDVPADLKNTNNVIHCPLIKIVPRPKHNDDIKAAFQAFPSYTHVIFTSKSAVAIFMDYSQTFGVNIDAIRKNCLIAVGKMTAAKMAAHGIEASLLTEQETAEGVVNVMEGMDLSRALVFWPHSAQSRPVISDWLKGRGIAHCSLPLYDTVANIPQHLPDLADVDEIVFTSPSTVDAFLIAYGSLPKDIKLTSIGPITRLRLQALS